MRWPRWLAAVVVVVAGALLVLKLGAGYASITPLKDAVAPASQAAATDLAPSSLAATAPSSGIRPISRVRTGPWGELRITRIVIEPLEAAAAALVPTEGTRWVFPGQSPVGVEQILQRSGLSRQAVQQLEAVTAWDGSLEATVVTPDADFVLQIAPEVREKLYAELSRFPVNVYQDKPFRFRQAMVDQWFESSRLSPETIAILQKLIYVRGDTALVSDVPAACQFIPSAAERAMMLKVLSRTTTLMMNVAIKPDTDVDALTAYWGVGKRLRDVRPLLESLTRVPDGHSMDVAHLLPRFARKRLYSYPARDGKALDPPYDCHWSSLNFWNDPPDDRLADTEYVVQTVLSDYAPVRAGEWRFGDVLMLGQSESELIHSCVYIAGDIVFTKNGPSHLTPWVLMELDDLLAYYEMPGRTAVRGYRLKETAGE